ncbi:MAG TPA: DEAD/DEAH box helicase [Myxococcota bacterium]|nr:DEAD/DEAH box helicase [Myxococcota bacterium]HQK52488.1 DEAD/DEAH box helicase [Myxococcota bacterium]
MLNPITFADRVVADFLRYQITTYPFADRGLHEQMRRLLNLEETRASPLLKGPYISLSRSFRKGARVADLVAEGVLHPHLAHLAPHPHLYGHQETAIRGIAAGKTALVATGTGSGKTECFLYPIISRCLTLRDQRAPAGVVAVIVYPMNALAEDQLGRLRELLAGTGVTFGMYVGKTPERSEDVPGIRLPSGSSRVDYLSALESVRRSRQTHAVHPPEERVSRDEMRTPGMQPRILLTNIKQLELLLTRQRDVELFDGARLDFLVFDEAHTFSGATGAETACLIRRLRAHCGRGPTETACVATSATIADPERGPEAGREFAARFFGVPAESVALVGEEYETDMWADTRAMPDPLPGDPAVQLRTVLDAVSGVEGDGPSESAVRMLQGVFQSLTGTRLEAARWQESLYDRLAANELVYRIAESLTTPRRLDDLVEELARVVGRPVPEEEILVWLALGAVSRREGRPLLRPVVHAFVRGVGGAVVTFPEGHTGPKLWLSAEDEVACDTGLFRLPILTCTTCGQHYFVHHVADFKFLDRTPEGGEAVEDRVVWRALDAARGGCRVVLVDRLVTEDPDEEGANGADGADPTSHRFGAPVYLCRTCGALHPAERPRCDGCGREGGLVELYVLRQSDTVPGYLTRCVACGAIGRQRVGLYREPARPVRAVAVSDVHVLAQNMLHYAERKRLLVFADNRQDAAFQAGWMQDHARRYRLRALIHERLVQGPVSVGDLTSYLDDLLDHDDDLSRALVPEVWRVHRKEAEGVRHGEERKRFLRILVLREVATSMRQRIGLEPWGRLIVEYAGLRPDLPFFEKWSGPLDTSRDELVSGVATLLDITRRGGILLDREGDIFSRFWQDGDYEVQRGYLPLMPGVPKGLKLRRGPDDDPNRVQQWLSDRGDTQARQLARRFGVPAEHLDEFFNDLWRLLTEDLGLLAPATLKGARNRALPRCAGVRQVDADRLRLAAHKGVFRCDTCRRPHVRVTPHMVCTAWRCGGTLRDEPESGEDYDLMVLDKGFTMLRPREHSAQIPPDQREVLERAFKGEHDLVNTLVCTPTLELGVDIGALDAVLMRNVPPLPSNYWQRAGRAGRRHRMAVNVTYARTASHDRAYFADPARLLGGVITPPRFNLKNELMVQKHVHAAVLTVLFRLARAGSPLSEEDRQGLSEVLSHCFPPQVRHYLFDHAGHVRREPFDTAPLAAVVAKHEETIVDHVGAVFDQGWPADDAAVVAPDRLAMQVGHFAECLGDVTARLARRLQWALNQMRRLDEVRETKGTLDPDEDALRQRCDRLVKKLKGIESRRRREAEGYDDTNTYSVLAAEGFLPGYGLDIGAVVGFHQAPRYGTDLRDFELRRPQALALREFVPGNLIYVNGHRFYPRFFHLEATEPTIFQVDVGNEAVVEVGTGLAVAEVGLGASALPAIPICDVDLPHQSHITDDEDYRFQLPVSVFGYEQARHGAGRSFHWGPKEVSLRSSVHLRLVNVGPSQLVRGANRMGYPMCLVCGQSRSALASEADRNQFARDHQERCGRRVESVGFFADIVVDALCIKECASREEAYSVAEALRKGASGILEMDLEDLQVLAIGRPGSAVVDVLLYDPMPGGSGLLDQMTSRWPEVVQAALEVVEKCGCATACIDCLFTFRNAAYHQHLNRSTASDRLRTWGDTLVFAHPVTPRLPETDRGEPPVNDAEATLRALLVSAGFPSPIGQRPIDLGLSLGTTKPDFFYEDPTGRLDGICIYLDGMSRHIHGNPATQRRDREIREELRNRGYEVLEIPYGHLSDRNAMARHFRRLARILLGREGADRVSADTGWFETARQTGGES